MARRDDHPDDHSYLAKEELDRYEDALKPGLEFERLLPVDHYDSGPVLFVKPHSSRPPRWAALLSEAFDLSAVDLVSSSASAVLFLRSEGRVFALVFGHGDAMLNEAWFEEDFGLKAVASEISPERLRNVGIMRPEMAALRKRQQTGRSSTLAEFEIDQILDVIKAITGRTEGGDFARKLTGSSNRNVASDCELARQLSSRRRAPRQ